MCMGGVLAGCEEQAVVQPRRCWVAKTKQMFDVGMIPSDLLTLPLPSAQAPDISAHPHLSPLIRFPEEQQLHTVCRMTCPPSSNPITLHSIRFPEEQQLHYVCLMLRDVGNLGSPYRRWAPPAADIPHSSLAADERLKRPLRPAGA